MRAAGGGGPVGRFMTISDVEGVGDVGGKVISIVLGGATGVVDGRAMVVSG